MHSCMCWVGGCSLSMQGGLSPVLTPAATRVNRCAWRRSSAATWTLPCATSQSPTCLTQQQVGGWVGGCANNTVVVLLHHLLSPEPAEWMLRPAPADPPACGGSCRRQPLAHSTCHPPALSIFLFCRSFCFRSPPHPVFPPPFSLAPVALVINQAPCRARPATAPPTVPA